MRKILFVEDDNYFSENCRSALNDAGFVVELATNASDALDLFRQDPGSFEAIVLDIAMPPGPHFSQAATRGGFQAGLALGQSILRERHDARLTGITSFPNEEVSAWFKDRKFELLDKSARTPKDLAKRLSRDPAATHYQYEQCFIVHGHDLNEVESLKAFLKKHVKGLTPIVLSENKSGGLTIIEKFEQYASQSFVIFALMTPDDIAINLEKNVLTRRARQNVIFEIGYFLGAKGRKAGKVLLLSKGDVEIPSDLQGIVRISIENGIPAARNEILNELKT